MHTMVCTRNHRKQLSRSAKFLLCGSLGSTRAEPATLDVLERRLDRPRATPFMRALVPDHDIVQLIAGSNLAARKTRINMRKADVRALDESPSQADLGAAASLCLLAEPLPFLCEGAGRLCGPKDHDARPELDDDTP